MCVAAGQAWCHLKVTVHDAQAMEMLHSCQQGLQNSMDSLVL